MTGKCPLHPMDDNLIQSYRVFEGISHVTFSCGCTVETKIPRVGDAVLFKDELYRVIRTFSDHGEEYAEIENIMDIDEVPLVALVYVGKDTLSGYVPLNKEVKSKFKVGDWVKNSFGVCGEVTEILNDDYYLVEVWDDDTTNFLRYKWHETQLKIKETSKLLSKTSDFMPVNGLPTGRDSSKTREIKPHWREFWGDSKERPNKPVNRYTSSSKYSHKSTSTHVESKHSVSTAGLIRQEVNKLKDGNSNETPSNSVDPQSDNSEQSRVRRRKNNW